MTVTVKKNKKADRPNSIIIYLLCILAPACLVLILLFIGKFDLNLGQVLDILKAGYGNVNDAKATVIWDVRMPRAIAAILVGGALAVSGGALQGIFRNPLVDSGILGVSAVGVIGILLLRWKINVISIGDKEARSLGVNVDGYRFLIIIFTALATAGAVCVSGTIGWIGLIIPHIARMLMGNDNRKILPICFSLGACFLLIVDNLARMLTGGEMPIGILTAMIGGPFYIFLLKKTNGGNWTK